MISGTKNARQAIKPVFKITELAIKAQLDGNEMLAYTYDANLNETMKAIAKKYDLLVADAVYTTKR